MKNRKRESCTSGTVRDEDGNILIYSARHPRCQPRAPAAGVRKAPRHEIAVGVGGAANSTYGDLTGIGSEREYNFLDLARPLLNGESNFRVACDFKELDVAKIAQISTSALST
jgi:hypothetical protein